MSEEYQPRHGNFTLNKKTQKDDYGNDYDGGQWLENTELGLLVLHWVNAKIVNGANGTFLSGKIGKPKMKEGKIITAPIPVAAAGAPPPPKPKETDPFDDDIDF